MARRTVWSLGMVLWAATAADAQSLGTFRWQLEPFCNVVTLAITQNGSVFRLEGTDDQCGGTADLASVTGTAFQNPDGTIGFGLNVVTTPGGAPVHVDSEIALASLSGTWRDSAGGSGTFVLRPGAASGGNPRPLPAPTVPTTIQLRADGGFVAGGTEGQGLIPANGPGIRMMWHPAKAAFRAGRVNADQWDDALVGPLSVALGTNTIASSVVSTAIGNSTQAISPNSTAMGFVTLASGFGSTAMGDRTTARGQASTAMGSFTNASGATSTSMGLNTTASGTRSTATGQFTTASGIASIATGSETTASGDLSTTIGFRTVAGGDQSFAGGFQAQAAGSNAFSFGVDTFASGLASVALGSRAVSATSGSFTFADRSIDENFSTVGPNQFNVRAAGGVGFYSNPAATIGVVLPPGGNQFTSVSDVNAKHAFEPLNDDDVLTKLAAMPVVKWSYKGQTMRHLGPMAQDFHAAFGLGSDPLRLGPLDVSGVALAGVRALEARTRGLSSTTAAELDELKRLHADEVTQLRAELAELRAVVANLTARPW